ncbi:unnamed protein product, partial [Mycena citricolor]
ILARSGCSFCSPTVAKRESYRREKATRIVSLAGASQRSWPAKAKYCGALYLLKQGLVAELPPPATAVRSCYQKQRCILNCKELRKQSLMRIILWLLLKRTLGLRTQIIVLLIEGF